MNDKPTFAAVLLKCDMRGETEIRDAVVRGLETKKLCLREGGAPAHPDGACHEVTLVDAAYAFGAFDFIIIVRGGDVTKVERFITQCIRSAPKVAETQTLLGVSCVRADDGVR